MKRIFDALVAMVAIAVLSPLLLALAIATKASSHGPVFYRGERVGKGGRIFRILKYRSMVANAESLGGSSTADGDCRITPLGRFMRKYKLDELPQLFNVLAGSMSLVGPRPEVREYTDLYTEQELAILHLRPGITDWASIWNSDEGAVLARYEDPDHAYAVHIRPTKLALQLLYAERNSVWIDMKILFYTARKVVSPSWLPAELHSYGNLITDAQEPESRIAA
jgi:lipopolysaccharide/colanic/teichoic acid biosynthesis glycosyltransferase